MIKNSIFEEIRLTQIIAFDSNFYLDFENINSEKCRNFKEKIKETKYFKKSIPKFKPFSPTIYDSEYAKNNLEKTITIESINNIFEVFSKSKEILESKIDDFDSYKTILEEYSDSTIKIRVSFDSSGIQSVRFDLFLYNIETPELIKLIEFTCYLIEDYYFFCIKKDLEDKKILEKAYLSKPMVYSVISSTKATINPYNRYQEILGISWKFKKFKDIKDNILSKILENDIAIHKGDILTVTTQAVFMFFPELIKENYHDYVEERINAIEIFWRQKFLLKKMHFELDGLINQVDKRKEEKGLKTAINEIQDMQIVIQSELDVYRNTIISVTHSYSMLFETLNKVFKTKNQYDFVQEKLKVYDNIHQKLYAEEQNRLIKNIQIIVAILGAASLVLIFILDLPFSHEGTIKFILILMLIVIILIFYKTILKFLINFFKWIMKEIEKLA